VSYQQSNQKEVNNLTAQLGYTDNASQKAIIEKNIDLRKEFWPQVWSFCGSDTFKTVEISVFIAILTLVLGKVFKIKESYELKNQEQRQKRIDAQITCIKNTEEMWNELYGLTNEVRFYQSGQKEQPNVSVLKKSGEKIPEAEKNKENKGTPDDTEKKNSIIDILKHIELFNSTAEEVVSRWRFNFPALPTLLNAHINQPQYKVFSGNINIRASGLILIFIGIIYEASASVAYQIRDIEKDEKDAKKVNNKILPLQDSLGVIQDVVKDLVHQPMICILKLALEPVDGWGANEENDNEAKTNIVKQWEDLFYYARIIKSIEINVRPVNDYSTCKWEEKYDQEKLDKFANALCKLSNDDENFYKKEWLEYIKNYKEV
jgi:hypothetical protein